jgi:hypothetical protein
MFALRFYEGVKSITQKDTVMKVRFVLQDMLLLPLARKRSIAEVCLGSRSMSYSTNLTFFTVSFDHRFDALAELQRKT